MSETEELMAKIESESESAMQVIDKKMEEFLSAASVEAVYKTPLEHGEALIIPAAEVFSVLGFGVGSGWGKEENEQGEEPGNGEKPGIGGGGCGGGGGSIFTRPVAVIVSTPAGVRVDPVFDLTKIALAGITAGILMFGTLMRAVTLGRKVREIEDDLLKSR